MSETQTVYRVVRGPVQARFATPVDHAGQLVGGGTFYVGQILPAIEPEQRDHLLSLKMIEPVATPEPESGTEAR